MSDCIDFYNGICNSLTHMCEACPDRRRDHSSLRSANQARQKEWDQDNQITLAYRGNELAGEVGEACNIIKKLERERMGIRGSRASVGDLADELADIVICADLIAMQAGIDLETAVSEKFNATSAKVGLKTRMISCPQENAHE
jgi:NTP pyrophosphatase (non-canonical NTP hydrolase)